jgi:hypothetical protein
MSKMCDSLSPLWERASQKFSEEEWVRGLCVASENAEFVAPTPHPTAIIDTSE